MLEQPLNTSKQSWLKYSLMHSYDNFVECFDHFLLIHLQTDNECGAEPRPKLGPIS